MRQLIGDRWKEALDPGPDTRAHHILWPASFRGTPRARGAAHGLAALLFVIGTCPGTACVLVAPVLLICQVLGGRLRDVRGVGYQLLTAAAWTLSASTFLLLPQLEFVRNPDVHLSAVGLLVCRVAVCWVAALAAGSSAAWITWVASDRRARPVTLYTVWFVTITVTAVATLDVC